jgi:dTDP-6-deoxy-L-talose 4-dehydrogenase (NAD+)
MILITGATGFLGRHICKYLPKKKYTLITRKKVALPRNFKLIIEKNIFNKNVEWWKKKLIKVKIVIHLAWTINNKHYYNSANNFKCFEGTVNLAIACCEKKISKFIWIGTGLETYYINPTQYKKNSDNNNLYSFYKYLTQLCLKIIFNRRIKNFIWIRIPYLYGDGEHEFKLKTIIEKCIQNKKKIKLKYPNRINNFIEVSKAAKKVVNIIFKKYKKNYLILNLSGKKMSVKKFVENIYKKINICKS